MKNYLLIIALIFMTLTGHAQISGGGGGFGGGGSSSASVNLLPSLAYYKFTDGSGTSVKDFSGQSNTATLVAGHNPLWVTNGLNFTTFDQSVQLPSTLNGALTFEFAFYLNPMPNGSGVFSTNQFPLILSNSLGTAGELILVQGKNQGAGGLATFANGAGKSSTQFNYTGLHVAVVTIATSGGDHLYVDGVEYPYISQGNAAGFQTSGNFFIGSPNIAPYLTSGFLGTVYTARFLTTAITSSQAVSESAAILAELGMRGVPINPVPQNTFLPQLNIVGDSISCAWNGTNCSQPYSWTNQLVLTNQPSYVINNWAVFNSTLQAMSVSEANRGARNCAGTNGPNPTIVFAGTNDLSAQLPSVVLQSLAKEIYEAKKGGCRVFVGTMISRTGSSTATGTPTMDAQKNAWDALLLSQAKILGADGVIDFAANPVLGADGANTNATYFLADHVHLTAVGETQLSLAASNSLNYYFSQYNFANPHVITATTQLLISDVVVSIGTLVGGVALTLPDCTGPSGEYFMITNPQAVAAVTVAGFNGAQPINGSGALTIPSNSTAAFRIVGNSKTTGGCQWTRTN